MNKTMTHLIALSGAALLAGTPASAQIIFPDASEQSSAAPSHHGGEDSSLSGDFSFIGGGLSNAVYDHHSVVGGGGQNEAGSDDMIENNASFSTVIGGSFNVTNGFYSVITGGYVNGVDADWATVGGGYQNNANGDYSTVGGGLTNSATALYSAVPGGSNNSATDIYSFAAGTHANDSGYWYSFVWGGKTGARTSAGNDTFNVWAANGIYLNGTVRHSSDRTLKEDFQDVDSRDVLAKVLTLPITEWRFKAEDDSTVHVGPMAQDFRRAFELGMDDKHIAATDADGVVLASIQGLSQVLDEKQAELDALTTLVDTYEQRLNELEARKHASEGGVQ